MSCTCLNHIFTFTFSINNIFYKRLRVTLERTRPAESSQRFFASHTRKSNFAIFSKHWIQFFWLGEMYDLYIYTHLLAYSYANLLFLSLLMV